MSWTLIEHQALTSSVASVTLGSGGTIPQTYKTLKLIVSARGDYAGNGNYLVISLNGTTTTYAARELQGSGSSASSGSYTSGTASRISGYTTSANDTSSTFGSTELTIPNYAGSTNKPYSADGVSENNATAATQSIIAGLWSSTSAITSITFTPFLGTNWVSGSTFTLYGLA